MRVALLLVIHAAVARADATVDVTLNQLGNQVAADLGLSVSDLVDHAKDRIEELYRVQRLDELLRAFADTAAFAQRGLGADYDVDAGDLLIGAAAGGVHGDVAIGTTNELLGGSIINVALLAGANLGRWRHPEWTLFANGFYEVTTVHGLKGHLLTLGTHAQYRIIAPRKTWTGLAATAGIEYARWSVGVASSIESHFRAGSPDKYVTVHMSSTGTLSVLTSTFGVPLELSTGVRLLDVLSFYVATGIDFTAGSSAIEAQLDSVLSINADHLPVGMAVIIGSGESAPSPVSVHALGGFAVHTRHARVFVQGVVAPGQVAASLGLRMAL